MMDGMRRAAVNAKKKEMEVHGKKGHQSINLETTKQTIR